MNPKDISKLKVLGKDYQVIWCKDTPLEKEPIMGKQSWGEGTIHIGENLDEDRAFDTLLHEAIHALKCEMSMKIEEDDLVRLASGLQCFLKDNFNLELKSWVKTEAESKQDE